MGTPSNRFNLKLKSILTGHLEEGTFAGAPAAHRSIYSYTPKKDRTNERTGNFFSIKVSCPAHNGARYVDDELNE